MCANHIPKYKIAMRKCWTASSNSLYTQNYHGLFCNGSNKC